MEDGTTLITYDSTKIEIGDENVATYTVSPVGTVIRQHVVLTPENAEKLGIYQL